MDVEAYKRQIKNLLPPGKAFPRDQITVFDNFLRAVAGEIARIDGRAKNLLTECYPLTCDETLTDWERITGLPAPCVTEATTKQERREAVHARLGQIGGQSKAYFIGLAAQIGFQITITEFFPFKAGHSVAGDPVNGPDWTFLWQVNAPQETINEFKAGQSAAGEPLRSWGNELLECILGEFKPTHTNILFTYGSN